MNPQPGIPSTIAEDVVSTNHSSVRLSHHPKVCGTVHINSKHSFIRSQSPPQPQSLSRFCWYCPRSPWLPRCLAPPYLPHPLCRHRCAKRHGLNRANTDQVVPWSSTKKWKENRGRNIFDILLPEKKGRDSSIHPFFSACFFFNLFPWIFPNPKKQLQALICRPLKRKFSSLRFRGLDVGYRQRLFGVAKPEGFDGSQLTNLQWLWMFVTQTEMSTMISLSVFLWNSISVSQEFWISCLLFCFLVSWALGQIQRVFLPFCVIFAASNFFCWKQTGRWSLELFPVPCQERCEDAEMRLSTCAETWTFGVITDLATQGARNRVYLVMENPTKKEWKVGRENPTYTREI